MSDQLSRRLERVEQLLTEIFRRLDKAETKAGQQSQQIQGARQS